MVFITELVKSIALAYLCSKYKVIIPQVSNSEDQTQSSVPLVDDCTPTEHDSLGSHPWL